MNVGVLLEDLDEREVAARVGLLEDRAKISNGLMRMNEKDEMELRRHGDAFVS